MTFTMADIRQRLVATVSGNPSFDGAPGAAVVAVLRDRDGEAEILFVRRADRESDPWSGHMAFPGGAIESEDASPRSAAERETFEEIGIDLSREACFLGALEPERPVRKYSGRDFVVAPFVYELTAVAPEFVFSEEISELHWTRVRTLLHRELLCRHEWEFDGERLSLPGFDVNGRTVWGLTFRILIQLLRRIDPEFCPPD